MTDGLRIAHPQDCPLEGNPEVGNPEIHRCLSERSVFVQEMALPDGNASEGSVIIPKLLSLFGFSPT